MAPPTKLNETAINKNMPKNSKISVFDSIGEFINNGIITNSVNVPNTMLFSMPFFFIFDEK